MSNQPVKTIIVRGLSVQARLTALGLDLRSLDRAIRAGELARDNATDHDPKVAAGWDAYRMRVRTLRDELVPRGWKKATQFGVELVCSPDGSCTVITRGGDSGVGDDKMFSQPDPQPKRKLGDGARGAITASLALNPDWLNVEAEDQTRTSDMWMLLVHRDKDCVRAELSLPTGVTADGDVLGWRERIILPEIDLSNEPVGGRPVEELNDADDVRVTRKR
jgi:hypothetical protein